MYTLQHDEVIKNVQNRTISTEDFEIYERITGAKDSLQKSLQSDGLTSGDIAAAVKQQIPSFWFARDLSKGRMGFKLVVNGNIPQPAETKRIKKAVTSTQIQKSRPIIRDISNDKLFASVNKVIDQANEIRKGKGETPIARMDIPFQRA